MHTHGRNKQQMGQHTLIGIWIFFNFVLWTWCTDMLKASIFVSRTVLSNLWSNKKNSQQKKKHQRPRFSNTTTPKQFHHQQKTYQFLQQSMMAGCWTCWKRPTSFDFDIWGALFISVLTKLTNFLPSAGFFNFIWKSKSSASLTTIFNSSLIFKFSTQNNIVKKSKI